MLEKFWKCALFVCLLAPGASAITVRRTMIAGQADSATCAAPKPQASFYTSQDKVYLWLDVAAVKANEELRVEWVNPQGAVSSTMPVTFPQATHSTCVVSPMQIAGYAAAFQPGTWSVRAFSAADELLFTMPFQVVGVGSGTGSLKLTGISRKNIPVGEVEITLQGAGFSAGSVVQLVRLSGNSYKTVASLLAPRTDGRSLTFRYNFQDPAEYSLYVQNPDGQTSQPQPIVVGFGGYHLPIPAGEVWELTQGNQGQFSHHGNTNYAYDIAPRAGRCVVAMKGGVAYTHDGGLGQDIHSHSFGNYITIDHGNGEYSHYGHLQTGTFAVANGQEVEAGQALAIVGTSGYSFGTHVHVQVTREFNIASPSVPFLFDDIAQGRPASGAKGAIVSSNNSVFCNCRFRSRSQRWVEANGIQQSQWWYVPLSVPERAALLKVTLDYHGNADLGLQLVSPSGKQYDYASAAGQKRSTTTPPRLQLPQPEPGTWRLAVNARATPEGPAKFQVLTTSWY